MPQPAQFCVVPSCVSQLLPSWSQSSQSPQRLPPQAVLLGGLLQSTAVHIPPPQLALLHATPQLPQLPSVSSAVSQPSSVSSLQSPQPCSQRTKAQLPLSHDATACA